MLRVFANDGDPATAADNLALVADFFNGCPDFHGDYSFLVKAFSC
jgi:hypothetical protein